MKRWPAMIVSMAALGLLGCAGAVDSVSTFLYAGPRWQAAQSNDVGSRARELEARGELAMALDHWRLVRQIAVDPTEAAREMERLEEKIAQAVRSHYRQGLTQLKNGQPRPARNHFLAALRLDPDFRPALIQINGRFSTFPLSVYLSMPGDHPKRIAQALFGDAGKAFLVAWFNDLPLNEALTPGTLLILPKLQSAPPKKVRRTKTKPLSEARDLLAKADFEGALALARQAGASDSDAQSLIHTIHLKTALSQIEKGQLEGAQGSLSAIPDGFAGRDSAVEELAIALQRRRNDLVLSEARALFEQGRYRQSLDMAQSVIEQTPDRIDARGLAAEASYRLALDHVDHERWLEARTVLEQADQDHPASTALTKTVNTRLFKMAQIHYRNGVKHFIDEDLESAVTEWEKALVCNPDHEKARENIENARRILQKIETLP